MDYHYVLIDRSENVVRVYMGSEPPRSMAIGALRRFLALAFLAMLLTLVTGTPATETTVALPNPVPCLSLSLSPTQLMATITPLQMDTVTFNGTMEVEQLQFETSTVSLQAVVNTGWPVVLSPQTMSCHGPSMEHFSVSVVVPPDTDPTTTANVIVTGSCKAPGLAPVVASCSAVVSVRLVVPDGNWTLMVIDPVENATLSGTSHTFRGVAEYDLGEITSVRVRLDANPWENATGLRNWSYHLNLTRLSEGRHLLRVEASTKHSVSPTLTVNFTVERDDAGGNLIPSEPDGDHGGGGLLVPATLVVVVAVCLAILYTARSRTTTNDVTEPDL
jgi:hypothetical protein